MEHRDERETDRRDRETHVGEIVASTSINRLDYTLRPDDYVEIYLGKPRP